MIGRDQRCHGVITTCTLKSTRMSFSSLRSFALFQSWTGELPFSRLGGGRGFIDKHVYLFLALTFVNLVFRRFLILQRVRADPSRSDQLF